VIVIGVLPLLCIYSLRNKNRKENEDMEMQMYLYEKERAQRAVETLAAANRANSRVIQRNAAGPSGVQSSQNWGQYSTQPAPAHYGYPAGGGGYGAGLPMGASFQTQYSTGPPINYPGHGQYYSGQYGMDRSYPPCGHMIQSHGPPTLCQVCYPQVSSSRGGHMHSHTQTAVPQSSLRRSSSFDRGYSSHTQSPQYHIRRAVSHSELPEGPAPVPPPGYMTVPMVMEERGRSKRGGQMPSHTQADVRQSSLRRSSSFDRGYSSHTQSPQYQIRRAVSRSELPEGPAPVPAPGYMTVPMVIEERGRSKRGL